MAEVRSTLERIRDQFVPPPGGFERLADRRRRRERNRRLAAAVVALGLSTGLIVGLLWALPRGESPRPAGTPDEHVGPVSGAFYPTTYPENGKAIMPTTFVDGSRAELVFDERLRPEHLGLNGFTSGGLGGIDRTLAVRYSDERIYQMHSGPLETYEGHGGGVVEVWEGPPGEFPCPHLIFRFGNWFVAVRTCQPDLSDAEKAEWARSLVGHVSEDRFLVLEGRSPLVLQEVGGHEGPEAVLAAEGGWPFITLRPGPCTMDEPAINQELQVMPDGQEVLIGRIGPTWHADWCEDGGVYVAIEAPDRNHVEAAAEGLRVRNITLAR